MHSKIICRRRVYCSLIPRDSCGLSWLPSRVSFWLPTRKDIFMSPYEEFPADEISLAAMKDVAAEVSINPQRWIERVHVRHVKKNDFERKGDRRVAWVGKERYVSQSTEECVSQHSIHKGAQHRTAWTGAHVFHTSVLDPPCSDGCRCKRLKLGCVSKTIPCSLSTPSSEYQSWFPTTMTDMIGIVMPHRSKPGPSLMRDPVPGRPRRDLE